MSMNTPAPMLTLERETILPEKETVLEFHTSKTVREIEIYVKSQGIGEFFESIRDTGEPIVKNNKWGAHEYWNIAGPRLPNVQDVAFDKIGDALLIGDAFVNMSFLRSTELKRGVHFQLKGLFPEALLTSFEEGFYEGALSLYGEYIRPTNRILRLTTERILPGRDLGVPRKGRF